MCGQTEYQIFVRVQPYIAKLNNGMERSVLAQDVVLVVEPCLVCSVSLLVDALHQHVSMGCKQTAQLEWISREGAVKTMDLKLI